jgi:hypothetical protein
MIYLKKPSKYGNNLPSFISTGFFCLYLLFFVTTSSSPKSPESSEILFDDLSSLIFSYLSIFCFRILCSESGLDFLLISMSKSGRSMRKNGWWKIISVTDLFFLWKSYILSCRWNEQKFLCL